MPRNISPSLMTKLAQDSFSWAKMVTVQRRDGVILGFTSWDVPIVYAGITYQPSSGISAKSLRQTADLSTDNLEIQGILDSITITDSDLINGKYDGALVTIFEMDPTDPASGIMTILSGITGQVTVNEGSYVSEVRSKAQKLSQQFGDICSGTCRANQLGVSPCAPGGSFADGHTLMDYQFTATVAAVGQSVAPALALPVVQINCGGGAAGSFSADTGFSGGQTLSTSNQIDISYRNSAPMSVYQTYRYGQSLYIITGLTPNTNYTVRLHFAETYFPTPAQATNLDYNGAGKRQFDVYIANSLLLSYYDVYTASGGKNIAVNVELLAESDSLGNLHISFSNRIDNAMISGIEVLTLPMSGVTNGLLLSSAAQPSGYYNYGRVYMQTGLNAGLSSDIKIHYSVNETVTVPANSSGISDPSGVMSLGLPTVSTARSTTITGTALLGLQEPFPYKVSPYDVATLEAGCDRIPTTCRNKFHNYVNFQGEPYVPGNDKLIAVGRPPG